jgi:drug/metabolite transporter (DMT)-like permease
MTAAPRAPAPAPDVAAPAAPTAPAQLRGSVQVLSAAAVMGTLGPISGIAYRTGIAGPTLSAMRAGVGAAILWALIAARRQPSIRLGTLDARERTMLGAAVLVNGLMNLALFVAWGMMTVALVTVVFYTYPLLTAVGSAALGRERLTPMRVVALAVAGLGIVLVLGDQVGPDVRASAAGIALAFAASACHAAYLIIVKGGFDRVPAAQATACVLSGGFVISGGAALVLYGAGTLGAWVVSPVAWAAILFIGSFGAAIPKIWVIAGVRVVGATRAAILMLAEPITAVVVAALVLGQTLTGQQIAGGALILAAVVLVQRRDARAEVRPPVPAEEVRVMEDAVALE